MSQPRISIVMPSFNQAPYIADAINSILIQKYPNLELIVIDGGSTDGTVDILRSFGEKLSYWCSESDSGQAHALNKGFAKATGDIMGFINSDDMMCSNSLWTIACQVPLRKACWINGYATIIYESDAPSCDRFLAYETPFFTPPAHIRKHELLYGKLIIPQVSTFWNRFIWQEAGGYIDDCYYAFDYKLWLRFACITPCRFVPRVLGILRYHDNSKTGVANGMNNYLNEVSLIANKFCREKKWMPPSPVLHRAWSHYTWFKQGGYRLLLNKLAFWS